MTGRYEAEMKRPTIDVNDFRAVYDRTKKEFRLTGKLNSNMTAHSIVAINTPDTGPTDYWKKAHATRLKKNGTFELAVKELSPSNGTLIIVFCFNNGYITGNGKGYGYKFGARVPYTYSNGSFSLKF